MAAGNYRGIGIDEVEEYSGDSINYNDIPEDDKNHFYSDGDSYTNQDAKTLDTLANTYTTSRENHRGFIIIKDGLPYYYNPNDGLFHYIIDYPEQDGGKNVKSKSKTRRRKTRRRKTRRRKTRRRKTRRRK